MPSGVPQGMVFGPFFVIFHISDIDAHLQRTTVRPFADDIRKENDNKRFQEDLVKIFDRAEKNNMTFNKLTHYCLNAKPRMALI